MAIMGLVGIGWRSLTMVVFLEDNYQNVEFSFEKALLMKFKPEYGVYLQDSGEEELVEKV